jgi:antitoxin component YwqK of YwqJK toxin-antitoxin module/peroxiredoxin
MNHRTLLTLALVLAVSPTVGCKFLARQIVDYTETWSSGMPKSRGSLAGGLQSGEWTFFYESGRPRAKGTYQNDRMIGAWTFFHENGVAERAGSFDETGKRTGEWTFHYADQTPQARGSYVLDAEDGPWVFYGTNGVVEREGQFDNGKLSGLWTYYHASGRPKATGFYHVGQRVGPWTLVDEQGQQVVQDFGSKPGLAIVVEKHDNGARRRTGIVIDQKPVGRWTSWHGNGALRFCCTLTGGTASGVYEVRDASGAVTAQGVLPAVATAATPIPDAVLPLVADVARPVDAAMLQPLATAGGAAPPPPPAVTRVVENIERQPARMPAAPQPEFTVKQKQEMESYVREYTDGPRPGGSMFSSYAPDTSKPRPRGQGERSELVGKPLPFQVLRGVDGQELDIAQYKGKKRVMIVVLRGFLGEVCCYCVAQTKALSQSRERLEQLGVEVLVIYPGARENEESFEQAYRMTFNEGGPPYRVFYDPDLALVTKLGIAGDLAFPSTIVLDREGIVQYAYVGEHRADRPAAKKLIEVIEGMQ